MILYNPLDGDAITTTITSRPRHCFLMTRLGAPIPKGVQTIGESIKSVCNAHNFFVIDANSDITGRDFLLKIWKQIAATGICIGICHEEIPTRTQSNIFYELGVAQAMGKETLLVKSPKAEIPSDFVRTEYVEFNSSFEKKLTAFLDSVLLQAQHYETVADQLDRNPILAIDYLKRAFLISGNLELRNRAAKIRESARLEGRAKNSVEVLASKF